MHRYSPRMTSLIGPMGRRLRLSPRKRRLAKRRKGTLKISTEIRVMVLRLSRNN
jgi:hypothetical protein